jgi:hypothetical protein
MLAVFPEYVMLPDMVGATNCFSNVCVAAALSRPTALAAATNIMSNGDAVSASVNATTNDAVFVPVLTVLVVTLTPVDIVVTVLYCEKFPPYPLFVPFPEFRKTIGALPVGNEPVGPKSTGRPFEMNLLIDVVGSTRVKFVSFLQAQMAFWGRVVRENKISYAKTTYADRHPTDPEANQSHDDFLK